MTTLTALIVLGRNGLTITDLSAVNTEYLMDDAIDFINQQTGTGMSNLAGVTGVKTVTVTANQNAALSLLLTCMLRATRQTSLSSSSNTSSGSSTSSSWSAGPLASSQGGSISTAISAASAMGSADDFTRELFKNALLRLHSRQFLRA